MVAPGDRLWVRECFNGNAEVGFAYKAGSAAHEWRPVAAIDSHAALGLAHPAGDHRRASVQRLQEISQDDAVAEGCDDIRDMKPPAGAGVLRRRAPRRLSRAVGVDQRLAGSWDANPWVWAR